MDTLLFNATIITRSVRDAPAQQSALDRVLDTLTIARGWAITGLYVLGKSHRYDVGAAAFERAPDAALSLMAPALREIARSEKAARAIVLVADDPIHDLDDWLGSRLACARIRASNGKTSVATSGLIDMGTNGVDDLPDMLSSRMERSSVRSELSATGIVRHDWRVDTTGWPMIWIPPISAYLHFFPVAKPQFEHNLAIAQNPGLNDDWYTALLRLNPRVSPWASSLDKYEGLFVTGLLPDDARDMAVMAGGGYSLPTVAQWRKAYEWLGQQEVAALPYDILDALAPAALRTWNGLQHRLTPARLQVFSLMRGGVIEWCANEHNPLVGMGQPRKEFYSNLTNPLTNDPHRPINANERSRLYGVRLLYSD